MKKCITFEKIYFLKILQCIKCSCCGENIVWRTSSYKKWIKFTKNLSSLHEKSVLHVNIYKLSLIYLKRKYKKTIIWKNYMIFSKSKNQMRLRKCKKKLLFSVMELLVNGFLSNKKHFKMAQLYIEEIIVFKSSSAFDIFVQND